ncbi:MAG TPA: sugar ABC transporter substrate-binding protein [Thermoanaerobaculia bacterium]|nr:sugar ABC transporter substrate-binding protein [Thermoanaerobaculia bacterium]
MSRLALPFALVLLLAGCARKTETVVRFWGLGREGEEVKKLVPRFERLHPGVRVEVQQIPWTAAHEKLLTALVGGAPPDVAQIGNTWIPEFAALGAVAPLDERIARTPDFRPADFFGGIWRTNVIDGRVYGVPWYVDTRLLFYRKDMLAEVGFPEMPRTWSAWRTAMDRLKAKNGPDKFPILLPKDEWQQPVALAQALGATILRDGGRYGAFRSPEVERAFSFLIGIYRAGLAPLVGREQVSNLYQDFAAGQFAIVITGPWNLGQFHDRLPPERQGDWATAPLPAPDGQPWPGAGVAGGASLVLFRRTPVPEAAWAFLEFLSRPDMQAQLYRLTGDMPPRASVWQATGLARDPGAAAFARQLEHVEPAPLVPEWEQICSKIPPALEEATRGERPLEQVLADLDREVDQILEKRRWLLERNPHPHAF